MTSSLGRIRLLLASWAMSDPEASWEWLQLQQDKSTFDRHRRYSIASVSEWLQASFAASLISIQSPLLTELFHGSEQDRSGVFNLLVTCDFTGGRSGVNAEADWALNCIKAINEFAPEADREKHLISLIRGPNCQQLVDNLDALKTFIISAPINQETMQPLLRNLTSRLLPHGGNDSVIDAERAELREWLEAVSPGKGTSIMDDVLNQNGKRQIENLQKSQTETDESVFRSLTSPSASFKLHLPEALELAERIEDPAKRAAAIKHLNKP